MKRNRKEAPAWRTRLTSLAWIALPSLVFAVLVLLLMRWPAPTRVEIDAITRRVRFHAKGEGQQVLARSTPARSLTLRGFEEVRLPAATVRIANPAKYDLKANTYPDDAWTSLPGEPFLLLRPAGGETATVTIWPITGSGGSLVLDRVFTGPAEVTLESPEKDSLAVELRGQKQDGAVQLPEDLRVVADYCRKDGDPLPYQSPSVTLRVRVPQDSPLLEFSSGQSGILLALEFPAGRAEPILGTSAFAVDRVEFLDQGPTGRPVSTLSGPGTLRYQQYPSIQLLQLNARDFLYVEPLTPFHLQEVLPAEQEKSLRVRLQGVAGKLASGPDGSVQERRLTRFDVLWRSPTLATLFTLLAWVVPTLAAARKFYRELHG